MMKKFILMFVALAALSGTLYAFDILSYPPPVKGGNILVNVGVGFGFNPGRGSMSIPPITADVEYALPVDLPISVGGTIGFSQYKDTWTTYDIKYSYFAFGGKANWHWGFNVSWLDVYTGIFFGYRYMGYDGPSEYKYADHSDLDFGFQIGSRFFFTKAVGLVLEFGLPFSKIGVAFKF
jgi:hypothetical protein